MQFWKTIRSILIAALWWLLSSDDAAFLAIPVPVRSEQENEAALERLLGQLAQINGVMMTMASRV